MQGEGMNRKPAWNPCRTEAQMEALRRLWGGKLTRSAPKRIQLTSRFMENPPGAKRVMRPSRFGNPRPVQDKTPAGHAEAVRQYRQHLEDNPGLAEAARKELRGYDLICSCPLDWPCHADVLLEVANKGRESV